jgi:hypothetical protein
MCPPPEFPDNWVYIPKFELVIHMPGSCTHCNDFFAHMMQASIQGLHSFREARRDKARHAETKLRRAHKMVEDQQRELDDLRRQMQNARREIKDLHEDLARERSQAPAMPAVASSPRPSPYDNRQHNTETRRRVLQGREERGTRSYSLVVQTPAPPSSNVARAPPLTPSPSVGSSARPESIPLLSNTLPSEGNQPFTVDKGKMPEIGSDDDDEDDLPRGERPEAITSIASSDFGRRWRRWVEAGPNGAGEDATRSHQLMPTQVGQFVFLDQLMRDRRSDALAQYLGVFRLTAQSTKKESRTEAQVKVCGGWKKPDWASSKIFNSQTSQMEHTSMANVRNEVEEKQRASAARLQGELMAVAIGQGLMINGAPHPNLGSPATPKHRDHPAMWQSYFRYHYGHNKPLPCRLDCANNQSPMLENLLCAYHRLSNLTSQMSNVIARNQQPYSTCECFACW